MDVALNVHPRINAALKRAQLSSLPKILCFSAPDLQRLTKLSTTDVQNLIEAASEAIPRSNPITALQLSSKDCPEKLKRFRLSSGCSVIDGIFGEGIPSQMVTEVCGESGSGKTQLCLQFCITVQLSIESAGLNGSALYISTEDVFPNRRFVQLVKRLQGRHADLRAINFTNNVYLEHVAEIDGLCHYLEYRAPVLLSNRNIKLIVLDSVAALFRGDQSGSSVGLPANLSGGLDFIQRSKHLATLAKLLHSLACQCNITVIVVNQVTDDFNLPTSLAGSVSRQKVPALGLSWSNLINMRLQLSRTENKQLVTSAERSYETTVRRAEVVFAPHLPRCSVRFIIDEDGVKGLA